MSVSVPEFWKLVIDSRLLTTEQCQMLGAEFGRVKGAAHQGNSRTLSQWLIAQNALTSYQAAILEAGRSGPFHYGDYKVYDRVEHGPFSGSFRAIHEPTSHPVMLKFVAGEATQDSAKWAALVERVQRAAAIVHPNLNRIFEPVDLGSFKFIAMEDIPGESLSSRVATGGPLQWPDACRAVRLAGMALNSLHQAGTIHGDVRPLNIWLEPNGSFRQMVDPLYEPQPLHVAQTDAASQLLERSDYMAPELAQSGKTVDALTDIYGLGCTLYYLLSGRPPFAGGDVMQKMQRHATEAVQPLEQFGVPPQVGQLVMYMMAKNAAVRYQQMSVVVEQITPYVDQAQLSVQAPAPPQTLSAYESWIKRKQSTLAATAASQPATFPGVGETPAVVTAARSAPSGSSRSSAASSPIVKTDSGGESATTMSSRVSSAPMSNKNTIMLIAGLSAVALLAIGLLVVISLSGGDDEVAEGEEQSQEQTDKHDDKPSGTPNIVKTSTSGTAEEVDTGGTGETETSGGTTQVILEDERLPWASPTDGLPIEFTNVPQSTGIYLVARLAEIVGNEEGTRVLKALGPSFASARKAWESKIGFAFEQVEQVVVGVHENQGQMPRLSFRVRLIDPIAEADLVSRWGDPKVVPVPEMETNYYNAAGGTSFFIPSFDAEVGIREFLMGSEPEVERVAKGEIAPLLLRDQQHLLKEWSDAKRHVTVLFAPSALLDETGQRLLSGQWSKLKDPIDWFLPRDHIQAGMLSSHFGDAYFYAEMRMKSNLNKDAYELAKDVRDRLSEVPDQVFNYVTTLGSNPYWEKLRFRFPGMIEELHRQTRIGTETSENKIATAVVNCYLRASGAHNLVAGTELTVSSQPGATVAVVGPPKKSVPMTIDALVEQRLDIIDIPQQDLVLAVDDIKNTIIDEYGTLPFAFDVKLMGNHLMMNGITKNQKVTDFKLENATYSEILTGICMKANPITTVKDPSELDQKLIWVIAPEPAGGDRILLITTRDAAAANNYPLPKPFQPKSGG